MKKTLSIALFIMIAVMTAFQSDANAQTQTDIIKFKVTASSSGQKKEQFSEHFADPCLDKGMALLAPFPENGVGVPVDTLTFKGNGKHPRWHLCCWNFDNCLSQEIRSKGKYGVCFEDGTYSISRDRKNVITMDVVASKAYKEHRTDGSQPWINFLIETDFDKVRLKDCKNLEFSYDLAILKCENQMGEAYNTDIHAAQCLAYLHVRNTNKRSDDYGKCLWLGVGSFDNRDKGGLGHDDCTLWDIGTSTFIYSVPDSDIFGKINFYDSKWHTCRVDVRKAISSAIKALTANGFMTDSKVDDFTVGGMNYGWELPGTFDVCSRVRNFSLKSWK